MIDILSKVDNLQINCLDQGFVRLVDVMPRLIEEDETGDSAIVQAARVSYGKGTKKVSEDRGRTQINAQGEDKEKPRGLPRSTSRKCHFGLD